MMNSLPSSSLISVANGIPLIAIPRIESTSRARASVSSRMMSVIAAAAKPIRPPHPPGARHPIFTAFGGPPPRTPRVRSHVTVSGERCSSSPISFSDRPFSLYSRARLTSASMLFIVRPRGPRDAGWPILRYRQGASSQALLPELLEFLDLVLEHEAHVLHRERAGVQVRVVEQAIRVVLAEALLRILLQPHDEVLADQVRQLVRRVVRVPLDLREGGGPVHAPFPHEEVDRLVERHAAAMPARADPEPGRPAPPGRPAEALPGRGRAESRLL